MKSLRPWVNALKIDPKEFALWQVEAPPDFSVAFWALEKGKLRSNDYYPWAQHHFGLCLVKDEFFTQPSDPKFWQRVQSVANWSPNLLPLAEWDSVIFIGCVEPPEDVKWSFPYQYVLAPWKKLQERYKSYQKLEPSRTQPRMEAPDGLKIELSEPMIIEVPPEIPKEPEAPDGLSIAIPKVSSGTPYDVFFQDDIPTAVTPDIVAPEGMATKSTAKTGPGMVVVEEKLPSDSSSAKSLEELAAWIFQQQRKCYNHSLLLSFSSPNLKVTYWEKGLSPSDGKCFEAFSAASPGIFRIIARSKQPYHGHVVDSPANREFFTQWGFAEYPANVSGYPIMDGNEVHGVLLFIGDDPEKATAEIPATDKVVARFTEAFKKFWSKAA